MSEVYVLASLSNQGKTTTAIALEKHFKNEGLKVACIQRIKGQYDVGLYLRENIYQYNMPLEAAKSRDAFEKWLPKGYDIFIFELWHPYTPTGAAFTDLFERINVPMSYQFSDSWKTYVESCHPDFMFFWDHIHQKEVTKIITKTPTCLDGPCVDEQYQLHMPENFVFDTFEPKMTLPKSNKTAIAAGAFPGEYWDIYPSMTWYGYDYHKFMKRVKKEDCDVVIIGECSNRHLKLNYHSRTARTRKCLDHLQDLAGCYWMEKDGCPEHCYIEGTFDLDFYMVSLINNSQGFGHAVCAEFLGSNSDEFSSWKFYQFDNLDIRPGDWQMPRGTETEATKVKIYEITGIFNCGLPDHDIVPLVTFLIDAKGNVTKG